VTDTRQHGRRQERTAHAPERTHLASADDRLW
jgi:hypothetical protein